MLVRVYVFVGRVPADVGVLEEDIRGSADQTLTGSGSQQTVIRTFLSFIVIFEPIDSSSGVEIRDSVGFAPILNLHNTEQIGFRVRNISLDALIAHVVDLVHTSLDINDTLGLF